MSAQPPAGPPPQLPAPGSLRCPRCSATVGPEQDWCLECGAPARTRLAPTPNWQLPTVAIGAIVLLAGALLAFAFVTLTGDDGLPAGTTPTAVVETAPPAGVVPPPVVTTTPTTVAPTATTTAPADPVAPATTVPGQTGSSTTSTTATSTTPPAPRVGSTTVRTTTTGTPATKTSP